MFSRSSIFVKEAASSTEQFRRVNAALFDLHLWFPRLFPPQAAAHSKSGVIQHADWNTIEKAYYSLASRLANTYPEVAARTNAEIVWKRKFQSVTRSKILTSVWIGPYCVDFLLPGVSSWSPKGKIRRSLGLVLEIDGPIHDRDEKMKKDQAKYFLLDQLGLMMLSLPNRISDAPILQNELHRITASTYSDTKSKKRLWKRIWLITLIIHEKREQFFEICGVYQ